MRNRTDEIVAPDMIQAHWPQSNTGTIVQPQPRSGSLFLRYFQPLPSPDPLHAILAHPPSRTSQQPGDPPVAVAAILRGQGNDRLGQRTFLAPGHPCIALCPASLPQQPASMPFRQPIRFLRLLHRTTSPLGAYQFPCATSRNTCFSKESSATSRFSRPFSFSNSFSLFACSSFSPPYSLRQR